MKWIDSHNHLHFSGMDAADALIAVLAAAGVSRCVVNATCEADWPALAALADGYPDWIVPAFGIHPWQAGAAVTGREPVDAGAPWARRLREMLDRYPGAGVGECGLDRRAAGPGMALQWPLFLGQLRIAREMERALTIHCVKAWGLLLDAFAAEPPPARFLLHSFGGSLEVARQLLPLGAYFSCSGRILEPTRTGMLEVFRKLPAARILLETDAPQEGMAYPGDLAVIGSAVAAALGIAAGEFAELTSLNARECFG